MTDYKTNIIKKIRMDLTQDIDKCIKAMEIVHLYQVGGEYQSGDVIYRNDMGFTPADARFLTSLCDWKDRGRAFTPRQSEYIKKLMPKYARQVFDHFYSNGKIRKDNGTSRFVVDFENLYKDPEPEPISEDDQVELDKEQDFWHSVLSKDPYYFAADNISA